MKNKTYIALIAIVLTSSVLFSNIASASQTINDANTVTFPYDG